MEYEPKIGIHTQRHGDLGLDLHVEQRSTTLQIRRASHIRQHESDGRL